jgi:hypothetical protein
MDLCNKAYGFLHLPSLFILLNPYARSAGARRFFLDGMPFDRLAKVLASLPPAEAVELLHALTCYVHERKHFHDLLVTPYGNAIVRHAFRAAMVTATLWADRVADSGAMALPIGASSLKTPVLIERGLRIYQECTAVFEGAIRTLEASAVLAQRQFAWSHFGADAVDRLDDDLEREPKYSGVLSRFWRLAERLDPQVPEIGVALHRLLVISLGGAPAPPDGSPDARLDTVLSRLAALPDATLRSRLGAALDAGWRVTVDNMRFADIANDEFYDRIGTAMRRDNDDGALAALVRAAFDEFRRCAREARREVLADERVYLRLNHYADFEGDLVEPCLYHYSVADGDALSDEPVDLSEGEYAAQHVIELADGRTLYSPRVTRADVSLGKRTMDRRTWADFMHSVGGSVALLEDVDWLHPAKTLWLRQVESATGLRFVRRRTGRTS